MYKQLGRNAVVLLGVGHTNAHVLRMWKMKPIRNAELICVSDFPIATYSGMMPGVLAGQYPVPAMEIDLVRLCNSAGARLVLAQASGLDVAGKRLLFSDRPPLSYDVLSIGIGSRPSFEGVDVSSNEALVPIKPMQTFLARLEARLRQDAWEEPPHIAVVGGGVGSIETAMCIDERFARDAKLREWTGGFRPRISLITGSPQVGNGLLDSTVARIQRECEARQINRTVGKQVIGIHADGLMLDDGSRFPADVVIWATGAVGPPLLKQLGLETDPRGFLCTRGTLQTTGDDQVFAVGDSGTMQHQNLPKAGVYAVRQGPVLWRNIQNSLARAPLESYRPQSGFLKLINLGRRAAIAEYAGRSFQGALWWRLKDYIDAKFMRMYQDYSLMDMSHSDPGSTPEMRCLGCGGKIGSEILSQVIQELDVPVHEDVVIGLDQPDDAAIVRTYDNQVTVTTDFFAAPFDDPYLVGRIATLNSASDCFVMGAQPTSALAIVQLPSGHSRAQLQVMRELMAGSVEELNRMGAAIVGGHTIEGPRTTIGFTILGRQLTDAKTKGRLEPGDQLVLSKPLGTGILLVALMQSRLSGWHYRSLMNSMLQSNQVALELVQRFPVHAITDVTGFGFLGHLAEMLTASQVSAEIDLASIPLLPGCEELAQFGVESTLAPDNRAVANRLALESAYNLEGSQLAPLFDPQTGGGLLFGVSPTVAGDVIRFLVDRGMQHTVQVGTVTTGGQPSIRIV